MSNLKMATKSTKVARPTKSSKLENEYSELSLQVTNELSKEEKKAHGIFITPKTLIQYLQYLVMDH